MIVTLRVNVPFQTQLLLTEYLDVKNTEKSRQQVPSSFDEPNVDIGVYFAKKKQVKSKKVGSLFHLWIVSEIVLLYKQLELWPCLKIFIFSHKLSKI